MCNIALFHHASEYLPTFFTPSLSQYSGGSNSELGIPNTIPIPNIFKFRIRVFEPPLYIEYATQKLNYIRIYLSLIY